MKDKHPNYEKIVSLNCDQVKKKDASDYSQQIGQILQNIDFVDPYDIQGNDLEDVNGISQKDLVKMVK